MVALRTVFVFGAPFLLFAQPAKRIPPPGVEIAAQERSALRTMLDERRERWQANPDLAARWKAVDWALHYNEFFKVEETAKARAILDEKFGDAGLVVHGYRSEIDDSVQPYGIVLPESYSRSAKGKWRLDVWLHGRGETTTELNFIHDRLTKRGEFAPPDTIVLHPFGRYCNGFKFAGATDVFEALADVQKRYRIDPDRITMRGFSMGGAGAWHLAAHHPSEWVAATPGAGFVDTEEFRKLRDKGEMPEPWVQKLWHWWNAKEYSLNFFNLPVIAYSGEEDAQKAAADIMAREMAAHGLPLTHIIGPKTGHRYEAGAKAEIARRLEPLVERGRQVPERVRFVTYTTRVIHSHWVLVHELKQHWERAEVDARIEDGAIVATTSNVNRVEFYFGPGQSPFEPGKKVRIVLDGKTFEGPAPSSDRSWQWHSPGHDGLYKRHGLQGPIDDAFLSRFIMVRPSEAAPEWAKREFARALREWRAMFRGEAIVRDEAEISAADIASSNIVLWGTPQSSALMRKWKAPMEWPSQPGQMLLAIYPNPDNLRRYVVLNSGHTFREATHFNNAEQTAKLPDWAIIDTSVAADEKWPGRIVDTGFFSEQWTLPARR